MIDFYLYIIYRFNFKESGNVYKIEKVNNRVWRVNLFFIFDKLEVSCYYLLLSCLVLRNKIDYFIINF